MLTVNMGRVQRLLQTNVLSYLEQELSGTELELLAHMLGLGNPVLDVMADHMMGTSIDEIEVEIDSDMLEMELQVVCDTVKAINKGHADARIKELTHRRLVEIVGEEGAEKMQKAEKDYMQKIARAMDSLEANKAYVAADILNQYAGVPQKLHA